MARDRLDVVQLAAGSSHSVLLTRQHEVYSHGLADKGRLGLALTAVATDHRAMTAMAKQVANGYLLTTEDLTAFRAAVAREQKRKRAAAFAELVERGELLSAEQMALAEEMAAEQRTEAKVRHPWGQNHGRPAHWGKHAATLLCYHTHARRGLLPEQNALRPGEFRVLEPRKVPGLDNCRVVQVACGAAHTVALAEDSKVYAWGWGNYGQLGLGCTPLQPRLEQKHLG